MAPPPVGRRWRLPLTLAVVLAVGLDACGSGVSVPAYRVETTVISPLGTVLVDGQGLTLYLFEPDHQSVPTCTGSCAAAWPPLLLPAGVSLARPGPGVRTALLGTVRRPGGALQLTYNRWPLYRWVGDTRPGVATGQALDNFGGSWYVVAPDGRAVSR